MMKVTIEKLFPSGAYLCSTIYLNRRIAKQYIGYTERQALREFRAYLKPLVIFNREAHMATHYTHYTRWDYQGGVKINADSIRLFKSKYPETWEMMLCQAMQESIAIRQSRAFDYPGKF